ncbi:MAG: Flagellar basal-body rod protein FlgF [Pseudomonadota bacterium]|jgi:flagellar basal-body rod protein FlgF
MDRLIFTSNATIAEQATARQVLVNELANVATIAFKRSYDVALQTVKAEGPGFDTRFQAQAIARDRIRLNSGAIMATGRPMDVAMAHNSVMAVLAQNGDVAFTRRGDLKVAPNGQLVNGSGHVILGQNGPINVPPGVTPYVNENGSVYGVAGNATSQTAAQLIDNLRLRDASKTDLSRREDGLFQVQGRPPGADIDPSGTPPAVIPKALEGSNVNPVETMTLLIDQARSFETQIKVIKEMKELDTSGESMMKIS